MSVRKILLLAAAGAVATTAYAGCAQNFSSAQSSSPMYNGAFNPSAYFDVKAGVDWSGFKDLATGNSYKSLSGNPIVVGADLGYTFMPHLGIELGGTYFTDVKGNGGASNFIASGNEVKQYDVYGALKLD